MATVNNCRPCETRHGGAKSTGSEWAMRLSGFDRRLEAGRVWLRVATPHLLPPFMTVADLPHRYQSSPHDPKSVSRSDDLGR
jgi:hypothetical protein